MSEIREYFTQLSPLTEVEVIILNRVLIKLHYECNFNPQLN